METDLIFTPKGCDEISGLSTLHVSYIIQNLFPLSVVNKEKLTWIDKMCDGKQEDVSMLTDDVTLVAVGSSAEGLNMPNLTECTVQGLIPLELSDLDILFVLNQYMITFNDTEKPKLRFCDPRELWPWEFYAVAETNDIHPGYVRINRSDVGLLSEYQDREKLLSNFRMLHMERQEFVDVVEVHGPALTIPVNVSDRKINGRRVPLDKVLAMPCKEWPPTAKPCIKRFQDKGWFREDLIQKIKDGGCHIVPVPHKTMDGKMLKMEWRISFATTERLIARTALANVQKQAYVAIKTLFHQKLKKLEILSSYHMKTVFFFTCERILESFWEENLFLCILFFLDFLIECIEKRNIPNFFIPENNLIDYITEEQFVTLQKTLKEIRRDPLKPLLSFFYDRYFDELGAKLDYKDIFAAVILDMKNHSQHLDIELSLEIFRSCSIAIMIKYAENSNYNETIETAKYHRMFLLKCKKGTSEVGTLANIVLSMVKKIEDQELVMDFCKFTADCFEGDKSFDCLRKYLKTLKE